MAHENTKFGQRHFCELHGSDGTLYSEIDWDNKQQVRGAKAPDGRLTEMTLPAEIWQQARQETVHDTYKDVFRQDQFMIGEWVTAVAQGTAVQPDFGDGLAIQKIIDAAVRSAKEGKRIVISG